MGDSQSARARVLFTIRNWLPIADVSGRFTPMVCGPGDDCQVSLAISSWGKSGVEVNSTGDGLQIARNTRYELWLEVGSTSAASTYLPVGLAFHPDGGISHSLPAPRFEVGEDNALHIDTTSQNDCVSWEFVVLVQRQTIDAEGKSSFDFGLIDPRLVLI